MSVFLNVDLDNEIAGELFNRAEDMRAANALLDWAEVRDARNVVITSKASRFYCDTPQTKMIPGYDEPIIFIGEHWLSFPTLFASVVVHEMVHFNQWVMGDLTWSSNCEVVLWKGVPVDDIKGPEAEREYEIPAYDAQMRLVNRIAPYMRRCDIMGVCSPAAI